jgi:hypothetical protein
MVSLRDKVQSILDFSKSMFELITSRMLYDDTNVSTFSPREFDNITNRYLRTSFNQEALRYIQLYALKQSYTFDFKFNRDNNPEGQKDGSTYIVTATKVNAEVAEQAIIDFQVMIGNTKEEPKVFDTIRFANFMVDMIFELGSRNSEQLVRTPITEMAQTLRRFDHPQFNNTTQCFDVKLQQLIVDTFARKHNSTLSIIFVADRGWLFQF